MTPKLVILIAAATLAGPAAARDIELTVPVQLTGIQTDVADVWVECTVCRATPGACDMAGGVAPENRATAVPLMQSTTDISASQRPGGDLITRAAPATPSHIVVAFHEDLGHGVSLADARRYECRLKFTTTATFGNPQVPSPDAAQSYARVRGDRPLVTVVSGSIPPP